jgi:polysaccharide chain length determinant protein (PEP-CTERM system associated)
VLPGKKYTPEEVLRIARERWWLILLPLLAGIGAGVLGFLWMPVQYRSETLIMVVPQQIPDNYVKPTMTSTIEDRLPSIYDQILSRSRLERIIRDFDLYKDMRAQAVMEDVVHAMRSAIEVKLEAKESFRVTYANESPITAQRVTERLASLFIEENVRDRAKQAESTSEFLESQLEDAKRRLVEQERRLEEYRRKYAGQLPSQAQSNLQAIQNAQMQLQALAESMNRARERRLLIERQIADAESMPAAVALPEVAGGGNAGVQLTAAEQLEAARARLAELRQRYTDDHPDVRAQRRTIRELQLKAEEEAKRPHDPEGTQRMSPSEMARQKRIKDLQAELQVIDHQVSTAQAEEARLKGTVGDLQGRVAVVPTRESELVELTRDYTTLQETYASLLTKREESKLAANLEQRKIGEQFRVLDPASLPEKPSNQKQRLGVLAGCAFGGLAIGLAMIGLLEYRDSTFKREEDVVRVLSLPVLALVPIMGSPSSETMGRSWLPWRARSGTHKT